MTRAGWVLLARTRPQPSGKVTRTPSTSTTSYFLRISSVTSATTRNLSSSGQSTRISGVLTTGGRSASQVDRGAGLAESSSARRREA